MTAVVRPQRLLHESLLATAETRPGHAAVVTRGERVSYGELADRARRIARGLQLAGVRRGDRVVVYLDNCPDAAAAIFGTLLAGGVFAVVDRQTPPAKLRLLVADSGAAAVVASCDVAEVAAVVVSPAELRRAPPEPAPVPAIPNDLASLVYTSGSTGLPKGVMLTHGNMVFARDSVAEYLRLGRDERIVNVLPLAFDYGLYQLLMAVRLGGTLVLERSFAYPRELLRLVDAEQVTVLPGVPTVWARLLALAEPERLELPSVRRITNTAAALPAPFVPRLRRLFPNALVYAMYGLTECKRVAYLEPELVEAHPTSVGRAIPGTEALVLGDRGEPVAPGEVGVLHVRGPHVMAGYWRRPKETAEMLRDGPVPGERMLCTHDRFTVDDDGLLYFVGRSDDIIKTRGEKVSPSEVENVLHAIAGVREAAVVGAPDAVFGESVQAFVVPANGHLSERDVLRACRASLEPYMVPARVRFRDELPKTSSGKVSKKALREELAGAADGGARDA